MCVVPLWRCACVASVEICVCVVSVDVFVCEDVLLIWECGWCECVKKLKAGVLSQPEVNTQNGRHSG